MMRRNQLLLLLALVAAAFFVSNVASTPAPATALSAQVPAHVLALRRRGALGDIWGEVRTFAEGVASDAAEFVETAVVAVAKAADEAVASISADWETLKTNVAQHWDNWKSEQSAFFQELAETAKRIVADASGGAVKAWVDFKAAAREVAGNGADYVADLADRAQGRLKDLKAKYARILCFAACAEDDASERCKACGSLEGWSKARLQAAYDASRVALLETQTRLEEAATRVANSVHSAATAAGENVKAGVQDFMGKLDDIAADIKEYADETGKAVAARLSASADDLRNALTSLKETAEDVVHAAAEAAANVARDAAAALPVVFSKICARACQPLRASKELACIDDCEALPAKVSDWTKANVDAAKQTWADAKQSAADVAAAWGDRVDDLKAFAGDVAEWAEEGFEAARDAVKDIVDKAKVAATRTFAHFQPAIQAWKEAIVAVVSALNATWDAFVGPLKSAVAAAWDLAKKVADATVVQADRIKAELARVYKRYQAAASSLWNSAKAKAVEVKGRVAADAAAFAKALGSEWKKFMATMDGAMDDAARMIVQKLSDISDAVAAAPANLERAARAWREWLEIKAEAAAGAVRDAANTAAHIGKAVVDGIKNINVVEGVCNGGCGALNAVGLADRVFEDEATCKEECENVPALIKQGTEKAKAAAKDILRASLAAARDARDALRAEVARLTAFLGRLRAAIADDTKDLLTEIYDDVKAALGYAANGVSSVWTAAKQGATAAYLKAKAKATEIKDALVASAGQAAADAWAAAVRGANAAWEALQLKVDQAKELMGKLGDMTAEAASAARATFKAGVEQLRELYDSAVATLKEQVAAMVAKLKNVTAKGVILAAIRAWNAAVAWVRDLLLIELSGGDVDDFAENAETEYDRYVYNKLNGLEQAKRNVQDADGEVDKVQSTVSAKCKLLCFPLVLFKQARGKCQQKCAEVEAKAKELAGRAVDAVAEGFDHASDFVRDAIPATKQAFIDLHAKLKTKLQAGWDGMAARVAAVKNSAAVAAIRAHIKALGSKLRYLESAVSSANEKLVSVFDGLVERFKEVQAKAGEASQTAKDTARDWFLIARERFNAQRQALLDLIERAIDDSGVRDALREKYDTLLADWSEFVEDATEYVVVATNDVKDAASDVADQFRAQWTKVKEDAVEAISSAAAAAEAAAQNFLYRTVPDAYDAVCERACFLAEAAEEADCTENCRGLPAKAAALSAAQAAKLQKAYADAKAAAAAIGDRVVAAHRAAQAVVADSMRQLRANVAEVRKVVAGTVNKVKDVISNELVPAWSAAYDAWGVAMDKVKVAVTETGYALKRTLQPLADGAQKVFEEIRTLALTAKDAAARGAGALRDQLLSLYRRFAERVAALRAATNERVAALRHEVKVAAGELKDAAVAVAADVKQLAKEKLAALKATLAELQASVPTMVARWNDGVNAAAELLIIDIHSEEDLDAAVADLKAWMHAKADEARAEYDRVVAAAKGLALKLTDGEEVAKAACSGACGAVSLLVDEDFWSREDECNEGCLAIPDNIKDAAEAVKVKARAALEKAKAQAAAAAAAAKEVAEAVRAELVALPTKVRELSETGYEALKKSFVDGWTAAKAAAANLTAAIKERIVSLKAAATGGAKAAYDRLSDALDAAEAAYAAAAAKAVAAATEYKDNIKDAATKAAAEARAEYLAEYAALRTKYMEVRDHLADTFARFHFTSEDLERAVVSAVKKWNSGVKAAADFLTVELTDLEATLRELNWANFRQAFLDAYAAAKTSVGEAKKQWGESLNAASGAIKAKVTAGAEKALAVAESAYESVVAKAEAAKAYLAERASAVTESAVALRDQFVAGFMDARQKYREARDYLVAQIRALKDIDDEDVKAALVAVIRKWNAGVKAAADALTVDLTDNLPVSVGDKAAVEAAEPVTQEEEHERIATTVLAENAAAAGKHVERVAAAEEKTSEPAVTTALAKSKESGSGGSGGSTGGNSAAAVSVSVFVTVAAACVALLL